MTTQKDLINSIAEGLRTIVNSTDGIDELIAIDEFVHGKSERAEDIARDTGFQKKNPVRMDEFLDALNALGFFDDYQPLGHCHACGDLARVDEHGACNACAE